MALEALEQTLSLFPPPVYCFHQIVHNRTVIARFEALGVIFVDAIEDVPEGATTVLSAHGVSPAVRLQAAARNLQVIDATCPLVTKVHNEARTFAARGFTVVLIGHRGHDEVVGVLGEAPAAIQVVESAEDIERLSVADPQRVAWVTQTTLSVDETQKLVRALRRRFPAIQGPAKEDICYATQNRQEAVRKLAEQADLVLVIGSTNSSNSQRLVEAARSCGVPAHLVEGPADIRPEWLTGVRTLALTAGASVPERLVNAALAWLKQRYEATIEYAPGRQELVHFPVPEPLRKAQVAAVI